jgi:hypothetical protein
MLQMVAVGLTLFAIIIFETSIAGAAEKGKRPNIHNPDATPMRSTGLYGVSDLAERTYEKHPGTKGLRNRKMNQSRSSTGKNKYIEYRKQYSR